MCVLGLRLCVYVLLACSYTILCIWSYTIII